MAGGLKAYLPQSEGLLPYWLLLVGGAAIFNSIQSYLTMSFTRRVYNGPRSSVTPLSARTWGTWTFIAAVVRLYTAYNINDPSWYGCCALATGAAGVHFLSELFIYRTAAFGVPVMSPITVASITLIWQWLQRGYYLR